MAHAILVIEGLSKPLSEERGLSSTEWMSSLKGRRCYENVYLSVIQYAVVELPTNIPKKSSLAGETIQQPGPLQEYSQKQEV